MQVGSQIEPAFHDLLSNGQAVGRSDSLVVFCFGPLPGERARVRVTSVKAKYAVAELVSLTTRSPERTAPFCPVFGECGGCQLQHLSYGAQLAWKRETVRNALLRIGHITGVTVRETIGMINPRAYRNKMSLVVTHSKTNGSANGTLGFYKQRSHEVVSIDGCPVVLPALDAHISRLNELLAARTMHGVREKTLHIVERTARATSESVVTFTSAQPCADLAARAPELLAGLSPAVGITNSFDLSSENAILGRRHQLLAGRSAIEEHIGDIRYRVSAGSFFQVNVEILGRIFDFMRGGLQGDYRIVDLYCGAGTFAVFFAHLGNHVVGVEENAQAIREARENAALNGLQDRARFLHGRVEDAVKHGQVQQALSEAHIVFLDPPRRGSDAATLEAIAACGVPNIWYLSCDPATLGRDVRLLSERGYRLGVAVPFDMFPHTGHVETLVTMYRQTAMQQQTIDREFKDAPVPVWPKEYPDFVVDGYGDRTDEGDDGSAH